MFVPLHDENVLKSIRFQFVTVALIVANVLVYLLEAGGIGDAAIASFAVVPQELFHPETASSIPLDAAGRYGVPELATLFTYMFFHGSLIHLGGNMLFLWVFGDNVEDALGHAKFLVFYLACGVIAALVHALVADTGAGAITPEMAAAGLDEPETSMSQAPLIGASGAVAGVIAAYLMLHPRVRVWVLALKAIPLRISALFALGLWIATQVAMIVLPMIGVLPEQGPVAWWAHIGGLLAGAILVLFMRRPGVPLFDRGLGAV